MSNANPRAYKLLPCPRCEGESIVQTARETSDGSVIRRRRCTACGAVYHSRESILGAGRDAGTTIPESFLVELAAQFGLVVDRER